MKSKSGKSSKKGTKKKMTEAEREQALLDWLVRVIIAQTLKEFYGKNKDSERD
ncbi:MULTISPECIES: hypothetical protein [unclassified Flavobacterium]|uniref:hypothetical protein n=1 Tax=unclassified Flavobacterium TaxID=196869 RepID=UPI0013564CEC|nr:MULTISPECIES: hypothetical protein [unclassified Flavobacterium]